MPRGTGLLLAVLALVPAPAGAALHEVPLPELVGDYQAWDNTGRTITVKLPGTPSEIRGVSLRLRGSAETGVFWCSGPNGPEQHTWVTQFGARMYDDQPNRVWSIENAPSNPSGDFAWTVAFEGWSVFGAPLPSWNFLLDGSAPLELFLGDNNVLLACSGVLPPPRARIDEAVLLLDADFAVPARASSWGRVKSSYR